jgi:hypothetical protein
MALRFHPGLCPGGPSNITCNLLVEREYNRVTTHHREVVKEVYTILQGGGRPPDFI